ncbi:ABC transporter ATP-binding protein [Actinomadura kijaniata]|uniref:Iron complex transport system ATP-binding protein n=1 Tax=Actinomadura namibiensis TaxID=182080 RepID=A0A7W3QMK1_ACTNM|nr:ABC transporter ATP-binding protein [Actinomadura namibiensis]MBA8952645.1 iron complex transport system ATP-binding protein [Actinomadura namibiensis]
MRISIEGLDWAAGGRTIVRDVTAEIPAGATVGLIGPNGSGKSSLLRCVAGLRTPSRGTVRYDGDDIRGWSARRVARQAAFVEQTADTHSELRIADIVALGRTPFRDRWRGLGGTDRAVIDAALARMELTDLADRQWRTLSGGERQRAHIARALAQQPWALLLDEPTNHLDVRHQLDLLRLLADTDQTVLVVLHDLPLAARFCDRLLMLHHGSLVAAGPPEQVLTADRIRDVFEVDAELGRDSTGSLSLTYR